MLGCVVPGSVRPGTEQPFLPARDVSAPAESGVLRDRQGLRPVEVTDISAAEHCSGDARARYDAGLLHVSLPKVTNTMPTQRRVVDWKHWLAGGVQVALHFPSVRESL